MSDQQLEVKVYVEQMAKLLDLSIPEECEQGVIDNFIRMQAIAALVTEFPLPDEIETAPIFQP